MVAARIIGSECYESNKRFLECKSEDKNPQTCLASGEKVAGCVFKVYVSWTSHGPEFSLLMSCRLRTLENQCTDSFHAYKKAMDDRWHEITECRKEQYAMEDCYRKFKNDKVGWFVFEYETS